MIVISPAFSRALVLYFSPDALADDASLLVDVFAWLFAELLPLAEPEFDELTPQPASSDTAITPALSNAISFLFFI